MDIKEYIKIYNVIPADVCINIINEYEKNNVWGKHRWYDAGIDKTFGRHDKEFDVVKFKQDTMISQYLFIALNKYCQDLNLNAGETVSYHGDVRLNRYQKGTMMSEHVDLIKRHRDDGIPTLTFLGLLNDDFSGGEFYIRDQKIDFKKGDILIFPSTFIYPHRVDDVTDGVRYSFVTWGY